MPRVAKNPSLFQQAEKVQSQLAKIDARRVAAASKFDAQRAKVLTDAPKEVLALIELATAKK